MTTAQKVARSVTLLGYILLIWGFIGLSLVAHPRGGVIEAIAIRQLLSMPKKETYNSEDLMPAFREVAAYSWQEGYASPVGGALIMLFGGILIGVGPRLKKHNPN
jgi:hypothetical protein